MKNSIYRPACRFFVINFHRKVTKNHEFSSKMMVDPRRKSRLGYSNHHMALKKSMKYDGKKHENKTSIFYTFTEYLWSENNLFFRFWNSIIPRSSNIFDEKMSSK